MRLLTQLIAVIGLTLRTLPQRAGSAAVAVVGIAGVVIVFVAVLSIGEGFRAALLGASSADTAMVMRGGSDSEMVSALAGESTRIIKDGPGIQRGANGPIASAELMVIVNVPIRSTGTDANVPLRGIEPAAEAAISRISQHMLVGALEDLQAGEFSVVIGRHLAMAMGVVPGDTLDLMIPTANVTPAGVAPRFRRFSVVGVFEIGM